MHIPEFKPVGSAFLVTLLAGLITAACLTGTQDNGQDEEADTAALQVTQTALTETAASPTPPPTANPAVVLNRFCSAVGAFYVAHREGVRFQNARITAGERLTSSSTEVKEQLASLVRGAEFLTIPIPAEGTLPEASRLYEAVRSLKQARAELITVIRASDHANFNPVNDRANVHARDVAELFLYVCPGYQVLPI